MSFSRSANVNYRAPENSLVPALLLQMKKLRLEKTARQICPGSHCWWVIICPTAVL